MSKITRDSWNTIAENIVNIYEEYMFDFDGFKNALEDYLTNEEVIDVVNEKGE